MLALGITIGVLLIGWIYLTYELIHAPLMPDDYEDEPMFYIKSDDTEIKEIETDLINHHFTNN